jgi:hypothetical protein
MFLELFGKLFPERSLWFYNVVLESKHMSKNEAKHRKTDQRIVKFLSQDIILTI